MSNLLKVCAIKLSIHLVDVELLMYRCVLKRFNSCVLDIRQFGGSVSTLREF